MMSTVSQRPSFILHPSSFILPGAAAGLVANLIVGLATRLWGEAGGYLLGPFLPAGFSLPGLVLELLLAATFGVIFAALVWQQRPGAGETFFWGLAYGVFWWFLGSLTLLPLLFGRGLTWDIHAAQVAFPSLVTHVWFGAITGLTLALIRKRMKDEGGRMKTEFQPSSFSLQPSLWRGLAAGLIAAGLLGRILAGQGQLLAFFQTAGMMDDLQPSTFNLQPITLAWSLILVIGAAAGLGYAWLYPRPTDGAGASLIRGLVYGYFWWAAGALTLMPLVAGRGLAWMVGDALTSFATLPGYLLFGSGVAIFYQWLTALTHLLFGDHVGHAAGEGAGTVGLRALWRGAWAGLVGGLLFTIVMAQIGFFPAVASLVGSESAVTGFIVHLVIAEIIGASYGLLFRRQSYDVGSALGWGVSYGFVWWILGPLTLMPVLLGGAPQWTVEAAAATFASLVGHLAYGAGLGVTFYVMEARYRPWWVARTAAEAALVARRQEQVLTS
ncbi:MAG: hypothetical protein AB1791_21820, partial [Chloroflexota bacterium]